jgi:biopolymer transport protein TolR
VPDGSARATPEVVSGFKRTLNPFATGLAELEPATGVQPCMKSGPAIRPEINVTPLVDILLVMLVIFLAAVTLTQQAIESQLPAEARRMAEEKPEQIVLEVAGDRGLAVNHHVVTLSQLTPFLKEVYGKRSDKTIYVAGAGSLPYGAIIDVMDAIKGAGVERMGVVTEGMRRSAGAVR